MNNPLPQNLMGECEKAAKILDHFITFGPNRGVDSIIPPNILQQAKGFAFLTVVKAGFVWSGRAGSGLVVARLPNGHWSAPSAIGTAGAGFGAQIGAQVVDFLLVLNTDAAVKAFTTHNVSLGANVSIAAGPMGRAAEASGTAARTVASVFSYSKAKGLFAGISLEGSVIMQRDDANAKFYGQKVSAKDILTGRVAAPPQANALYRALESKIKPVASFYASGQDENVFQSDLAQPRPWETNYKSGYSPFKQTASHNPHQSNSTFYSSVSSSAGQNPPPPLPPASKRGSTGVDNSSPPTYGSVMNQMSSQFEPSDEKATFAPPALPPRHGASGSNEFIAVALYDFAPERDTDLAFLRGDRIKVLRKTGSDQDWWYGEVNGLRGNFPSNYVSFD